MTKKQKSNRETKKPKAASDGTKKQKKDSTRHDSTVARLFKVPQGLRPPEAP
jgi:hypothetical protein